MLIEAIKGFEDYENGNRWREPGERWEVTPKRFEAINSTKWGVLARAVEEETLGSLTKAELLEKAKGMGIAVPKKATRAQVQKLVEEAL